MSNTNINLRKVSLNNRINNLVTYEQYMSNPNAYVPKETVIAINGTMYPVITQTAYESGTVGIVMNTDRFINRYNNPSPYDKEYMVEGNEKVIDFNKTKSYHEVIEKQQKVRDLKNEILTNSDNKTVLKIGDNDAPAMVGIKTAINCKECDINAYEQNFEGNFPNDRRILSEDNITLGKIIKFANAMDMKISMTIEDKNPDVPNPIGRSVTVELTGGSDDE